MKKSTMELLIILLLTLITITQAILSPGLDPFHDITNEKQFGCKWKGGPSPILYCTCEEYAEQFYIEKNTIPPYSVTEININKCKNVTFGKESIENMRNLRTINLENIQRLEFEENSIYWHSYRYNEESFYGQPYDISIPSLKINITNCNITTIARNTFKGRISDIIIDSSTIDTIQSYAFSTFQSENIQITNTKLNNVLPQSFKKFSTENLLLKNITINLLPSRSFSDVIVYNHFIIENCHLHTLRSGAFIILHPKIVQILNTIIEQLDGEAFKIQANGNVMFRNNLFFVVNDGTFRAITSSADTIRRNLLTFDSNTFTTLTRDSLTLSNDFIAKYINMNINTDCDCKNIDHNIKDSAYYNEIRCKYDDEYVTISEFRKYKCSILNSYSTTFIIVGCVVFLLVLIITGLIFYYKKVHRSKTYGKNDEKKTNLSLIVPDGRTYRETELHVIVERTDLLTTDL